MPENNGQPQAVAEYCNLASVGGLDEFVEAMAELQYQRDRRLGSDVDVLMLYCSKPTLTEFAKFKSFEGQK